MHGIHNTNLKARGKHKGALTFGTFQHSAWPGDGENTHKGVQPFPELTATLAAASSWTFLDLQAEDPI